MLIIINLLIIVLINGYFWFLNLHWNITQLLYYYYTSSANTVISFVKKNGKVRVTISLQHYYVIYCKANRIR